jgi:hypothetical protein
VKYGVYGRRSITILAAYQQQYCYIECLQLVTARAVSFRA